MEDESYTDRLLLTEAPKWQRRKLLRIADIRNRNKNPCCLGFGCLVGAWSLITLAATFLCYVRLVDSMPSYKEMFNVFYTPLYVTYQR